MVDRVIRTFFDGRLLTAGARHAWALAILLAPLAFLAGLFLQRADLGGRKRAGNIDREAAIAMAHRVAREHGMKTDDWNGLVRVESDPDISRYLDSHPGAARDVIQKLAPAESLDVTLLSPRHDGRANVRLAMDGSVLGFQVRGRPATPRPPVDVSAAEAAHSVLLQHFGAGSPFQFGAPEVSTLSREGGQPLQAYHWRTSAPGLPELEISETVDVREGYVIGETLTTTLDEKYRDSHRPHRALMTALGSFFTIYVVVLVILVMVRYIQRTLQKEISHLRALVIALAVAATFITYIQLSDQMMPLNVEGPNVPPWLLRLIAAVVYLVIGAFIGLSYSASEGDLREYHPGKLTSLDAILTGKVFSRNSAASIIFGMVVGAWMLLAHNSVLAAFHLPSLAENPETMGLFVYSRQPLLMLLISTPIGAIMESLTLLLPISILHRAARNRTLVFSLLIPLAFAGSLGFTISQSGKGDVPLAAILLICAVKTAGLLLVFFAYDLLACVAALCSFAVAVFLFVLLSVVSHGGFPYFAAIAVLVIFVAIELWFLFRGREVRDEEVRPRYARRLAERIQLEAEVTAAREAQLRLLPVAPPKIEGLAIAATCTAADEVGGDFYDFFRLAPHRLGLLVSDGGGRGLATALSIALAKGYLMQKVHAALHPLDTLRALRSALGSAMQGDESSGFCYAVIDTQAGTFEYARTGISPCVVAETPVAESLLDGSVFAGKGKLGEGLRLIFYTDGIGARLDRKGKSATDRWMQQVLAWHRHASAEEMSSAILREVFSGARRSRAKLQDDVTLVVIAVDRAGARTREQVA